MSPGSSRRSPALTTGKRPSGSLLAALVVFAGLVWLLILALGPATEFDWLGPGPRTNLELGTDAGALFYTEIDLETRIPVIGMMPDPPRGEAGP